MNHEEETMLRVIDNQKNCEFSLRFILQKDEGQWKNCFTLLKLIKKGTRREIQQDYGEYLVCEKILSIEEGVKVLNLLRQTGREQGKLVIPDYAEFQVSQADKAHFVPSKQRYGIIRDQWPFRYCSFRVAQNQQGSPQGRELLKNGLPYYPDVGYAIISLCELATDYFSSYGQVYALINDYRARIESLTLAFSKAKLKLDSPETKPTAFVVKTFAKDGQKIVTLGDAHPKSENVEFEIGFYPSELHVALLNEKDGVKMDTKEFGTWRAEADGVFVERPEEEVIYLIGAGEGQDLEYKSEIAEENKNDFIKTIIAFLNSNKGVILVGVSDDGTIIGSKRSAEDLQKMIHDNCDPPPRKVKIEEKMINDKRVLVVDVPLGDDPPYQSKRDRNFYTRHNASDMRMERSELVNILKQREETIPEGTSY